MKFDLSKDIDRKKATTRLDALIKKGAKAEIKEHRGVRSVNQNSYLHVCIGMVALETGYTIEEAKTELKREFSKTERGRFSLYEKNGKKFLMSTALYDSKQMTNFIEFIRDLASEQLGCYIPTSEEYLTLQFEIDKELEKLK